MQHRNTASTHERINERILMDVSILAVVLALGGLAGAAAVCLATKRRGLQAQTALQIELAQLLERVRLTEHERAATEVINLELRRQSESLRDTLDSTRDECAQLSERSLRVPQLEAEVSRLNEQYQLSQEAILRLSSTDAQKTQALSSMTQQRQQLELNQTKLERALSESQAQLQTALTEKAHLQARLESERQHNEAQLDLLLKAKESLSDQFKSLASDILEEKSKRFAEQNQLNLGQLLEPLKSRLTAFQGKVEEVYVQEGKDRCALSEQVRQLVQLNQALSQEAKNLTQALSGSVKTQGNWGELILERVLEASGLRKGLEYHIQQSHLRDDGSRAQPDVVIHLPEERRLVVDAKVSLVAYERSVNASTEEARGLALRQHLDSVKAHIKGLSDKKYEALYKLQSLDFVLMFIPIEPAFMLAVSQDNELFMDAWQRNVLMVSPSTLLFVVRTVAHLWRQEAQSRNAQDIAKRGAELYDKLCGFVEDLQNVGQRLGQAQTAFEGAQKKLVSGKGNLIRQAQMLKELGVKPSKSLTADVLERAATQEDGLMPIASDPDLSCENQALATVAPALP